MFGQLALRPARPTLLLAAIPVCAIQGVPIPCTPPPQHNWARPHAKPIYFHDPTSIQNLHARFQITNLICLLPVTWFMMRGRAHFCEQILHNFLGCFNQNGYKSVNNWRRPLYDISF